MKLTLVRWLSLIGVFGLLNFSLAWHAWLAPSIYFPISLVVLVTTLPLLFIMRGVLHGRPRTHLWAAFVSLLYFMHGVVEAFANPDQRWFGLVETGLSMLLFFAASLYARWGAEAGR